MFVTYYTAGLAADLLVPGGWHRPPRGNTAYDGYLTLPACLHHRWRRQVPRVMRTLHGMHTMCLGQTLQGAPSVFGSSGQRKRGMSCTACSESSERAFRNRSRPLSKQALLALHTDPQPRALAAAVATTMAGKQSDTSTKRGMLSTLNHSRYTYYIILYYSII